MNRIMVTRHCSALHSRAGERYRREKEGQSITVIFVRNKSRVSVGDSSFKVQASLRRDFPIANLELSRSSSPYTVCGRCARVQLHCGDDDVIHVRYDIA